MTAIISSRGKSRTEISSGDSDFVIRRSKPSAPKDLLWLNEVALLGGESGIANK